MESLRSNTALHVCAQSQTDHSLRVVQLLLESNAHPDSLNGNQQTAFDLAQTSEMKDLLRRSHSPFRLKCLCARLLMKTNPSIPAGRNDLQRFLRLHGASLSPDDFIPVR